MDGPSLTAPVIGAPAAELATNVTPKAEANVNALESASTKVKADETISRAKVESKNSQVNIQNNKIAGASSGGGPPSGGTGANSPRHLDPTIEKFSPLLT
jgi:hypothetical protein